MKIVRGPEVPNRPSNTGRALGANLARLTDKAEADLLVDFPNHTQRCKTCAFKAATFPNGCLATVMDAMKCVVEGIPFMCHQVMGQNGEPKDVCAGYMIAISALNDETCPPKIKSLLADWELSAPFTVSGEL